ncbi:MAG: hypothetical protein ACYDCN_14755 [Bacteroidia bacterium]
MKYRFQPFLFFSGFVSANHATKEQKPDIIKQAPEQKPEQKPDTGYSRGMSM